MEIKDESCIVPNMMNQPPSPPELYNNLSGKCTPEKCNTIICHCYNNEHPCTVTCKCEGSGLSEGNVLCVNLVKVKMMMILSNK